MPPLPAAAEALWEIDLQLHAGRGGNGFGLNPVGWPEIAAWQRVTGTTLTPWEAETLVIVDRAVRAVLHKEST